MIKLSQFYGVSLDYIITGNETTNFENNSPSLRRLQKAFKSEGINLADIDKLSTEQFKLIVNMFKQMINKK